MGGIFSVDLLCYHVWESGIALGIRLYDGTVETRRVTAEIFSIVGGIRHEFTSDTHECSFQKAYGERQRRRP